MVILPDGLAGCLVHLHVLLDGGTLAPLSPTSTPERFRALAARFRPGLVITSPALARKCADAGLTCPLLLVDEQQEPARWECVDGDATVGPSIGTEVRVVLFTSGSTGEPKGVCLSSRSLLAAAAMNVDIVGLQPGRRSLSTVPLHDYYGLIQLYSHLLAGAELVIGETAVFAAELLRRTEQACVTDLVGVPYGLRGIFRAAAKAGTGALRRLEVVTSSSEALGEDVMGLIFATCPHVTIFDVYGLTEAGRACSRSIRLGDLPSRSVGRPSPGVTITAGSSPTDPEELVIRGPNLMLGYLSRIADDGRLSYEAREFVHTGDLGFVDEHGDVHLTGRRDHMLNIHGDKIHPAEIESIAFTWEGVADARARLEADEDPELILEVVSQAPEIDLDGLRRYLRRRLPAPFAPARITQVAAIEHTDIGSKTVRT